MAFSADSNPLCGDVRRPLDFSKLKRGWDSARKEYDYWVPPADIEGQLPRELRGTLFRNGPGLFEIYGKRLIHRKQVSAKPSSHAYTLAHMRSRRNLVLHKVICVLHNTVSSQTAPFFGACRCACFGR